MYKKQQKAYMTAEAALVFPLIIGGIIFTIYLGFYLYNVCTINQISYVAALRGSQLKKVSVNEIEDYVREELKNMLINQLLASEKVEQEVKVTMGKVKVKFDWNIEMPFAKWISLETKIWPVEKEVTANRLNPVDIIRGVRRMSDN